MSDSPVTLCPRAATRTSVRSRDPAACRDPRGACSAGMTMPPAIVVVNVTAVRIGTIRSLSPLDPGGRRLIVSSSRRLSQNFPEAPSPALPTVRFSEVRRGRSGGGEGPCT